MLFSTSLLAPLFAVLAAASPLNLPRVISPNHGTIVEPTSGTVVASDTAFPFTYQDSNWCEGGYTPITVWLLDYAPTTDNLNATGQFLDATYYFGAYLIGNFGLGPIGPELPPPATLTMPDVSELPVGSDVYLAVVETANNCPPGNQPLEYGLTSTLLVTA
ncbi:hypothetical protein DFH07DRAFT_771726 [Mycena maculata]|uniref:Uncharacterized protein n=1 Tax=Mycena maculata TaxID=230809 RepID=A0AAD7JC70_9AGAR|nr:hypothetical protein DFH07DRAFT_771726 [Mycena maculata]